MGGVTLIMPALIGADIGAAEPVMGVNWIVTGLPAASSGSLLPWLRTSNGRFSSVRLDPSPGFERPTLFALRTKSMEGTVTPEVTRTVCPAAIFGVPG